MSEPSLSDHEIPSWATVGIRIKMLMTVRPDLFGFERSSKILIIGQEYDAVSNQNGAISGICEIGGLLGVKPGEFEFLSAPEWILRKWTRFEDGSGDSALKLLKNGKPAHLCGKYDHTLCPYAKLTDEIEQCKRKCPHVEKSENNRIPTLVERGVV
jgi:hypothetical protein